MLLPVATALVLLCCNGFYFLAEHGLTGQIVLFTGTDAFEMLLMALVNDSGGCLETVPDLFTLLLGHRTDLTVFLVEFLKLVERTNDIFFVGQILCDFTEMRLGFEIFLEVFVAGDTVQT